MVHNIFEYFQGNMDTYLQAVSQNLEISLISLLAAVIIGIPFGILSSKNKTCYKWVTTVFNTLRIVPSLAVLILLIPIVGAGVKPAVIALVLLGIPPILINTALALENAGYKVERKFNIASSVIHTSIVNNEIDLYPEYTGTGLLSILKLNLITDPQKVYDTVKSEYEKKYNLIWLNYSPANDGQGLVIRTDAATKLGIKTISDLQANAGKIRFASQGEFDKRDDGIPGLEKVYGKFAWESSKIYDNGLKYEVLSKNEADAAPAYTTEGQLVKKEFTLLEDDKHVWPPYNLAPVVRKSLLDSNPDIAGILNKINAGLDTKKVTALNAAVDVDKREYEEVAKEYYNSIK